MGLGGLNHNIADLNETRWGFPLLIIDAMLVPAE